MRIIAILIFCFTNFTIANAQLNNSKKAKNSYAESEKYITFNPLALAEPHMAIGAGFGNRFTERSEYFAEFSYVMKPIFYDMNITSLNGYRLLTQYRYHFLQRWRPLINLGKKRRDRTARLNPFVGVECRIKRFSFSDNISPALFLQNSTTGDIIKDFSYKAKALVLSTAIVFGGSYNINDKWKLEIAGGIGGRNRRVSFKNLPNGYEVFNTPRLSGFRIPAIYENSEGGTLVYAIRVKYFFERK